MQPQANPVLWRPPLLALAVFLLACAGLSVAEDGHGTEKAKHVAKTLRGRVVWMADELAERYGIATVAEARERVLALKTADGRLYPMMEDVRGRSFRRDKRLREMDLELLVRRYAGSPMVQVIRVYEVRRDDEIFLIDYWCDVCAIVMFEQGPCACCQDDNRLRKRLVEDGGSK